MNTLSAASSGAEDVLKDSLVQMQSHSLPRRHRFGGRAGDKIIGSPIKRPTAVRNSKSSHIGVNGLAGAAVQNNGFTEVRG